MPLLASWGLRLWFGQADAKAFAKGIERKSAELIRLPKPLFQESWCLAQRHRVRAPQHPPGRAHRDPRLVV